MAFPRKQCRQIYVLPPDVVCSARRDLLVEIKAGWRFELGCREDCGPTAPDEPPTPRHPHWIRPVSPVLDPLARDFGNSTSLNCFNRRSFARRPPTRCLMHVSRVGYPDHRRSDIFLFPDLYFRSKSVFCYAARARVLSSKCQPAFVARMPGS